MAAAISTHCLDISEPKTMIGLLSDYRPYTARWALADLPARRRRQLPRPTRTGSPRRVGCIPALGPDGGGVGDTPPPSAARAGRPRRFGGAGETAHHHRRAGPGVRRCRPPAGGDARAAAPAPAADSEHDDQEPESGRQEAVDLTALRALRKSRTDVEALDLTAERLRHLGDAFTAAADRARATMDRYAHRDDADDAHPVREDDQRAHRPQEPGPHRGREAGH